jgi:2-octaprenyl-6-methoxyphenol hydroxylase
VTEHADVVIIGGGPVGCALALALRDTGLQVALLEARPAASGDARPLALSYGSRLILDRLNLWPALAGFTTPIRRIHVSQRGGFGRVELDADEAGMADLGYVIDYGRLAQGLAAAVATTAVQCRSGARVTAWQAGAPACVEYVIDGESRAMTAQLLVIADGGTADGGAGDNGDAQRVDYDQCAVTARVVSERPHNNIAYERFTRHGPLALLPDGKDWALVWTTTPARADELYGAEPAQFLDALHAEFGSRAGAFTAVTARARYPLRMRRTRQPVQDHVVRIGNAAQSLHPVAGQGFNLGLRDAWELGEQLVADNRAGIGSSGALASYRARRRVDRGGGVAFTHTLVQLFSNDVLPLRLARGTGLALLGCIPPLKNFVVRRMTFGARG